MRQLPRNRRIAIVCSSCAAITATLPTLLTRPGAGGPSFSHHLLVGGALGISFGLLVIATVQLRRGGKVCPRGH